MNPNLPDKVTLKIETLCEQGCVEVNQVIEDVKQGKPVEQLADCNRTEIESIIDELSQIMAVYDEK